MKKVNDSNQSKELGKKGEEFAAVFLAKKGYKIRHRNWHFGHKELDIVATYNGMLVIAEVKTRWTSYWEEPKESVRRKKQRFIIEAAEAYVQEYDLNMDVQFDIISIVLQDDKYELEHIQDAFQPTF
ncbi:MAG: YraN family protein [Bacteroidales bacterium]|nr:MAG: YraN family protein [Bacteroidales bacterium]